MTAATEFLYAAMYSEGYCSDDWVVHDVAAGTWTLVNRWVGDFSRIPGFPSKEMAMAIGRALDEAYMEGKDEVAYDMRGLA